MKRIYLDNNATTSVDEAAIQAMHKALVTAPKNPSSIHYHGRAAKADLIQARSTISSFLKVKPQEIIFTSGGTEGVNLLVSAFSSGHIISTKLEHSCIYQRLQTLPSVTYLKMDQTGLVTKEMVKEAIQDNTSLIVLSAVNSETGVKLPIDEIAEVAKEHHIPLILDAVALLGKEIFSIPEGVTGMAFSSHKFHGPQGTGFIYLKENTKIPPLFFGGNQEYKIRNGTPNLPAIMGLEQAVLCLKDRQEQISENLRNLRDTFEKLLIEKIPSLEINAKENRVSNTSNIYFKDVDGESLLINLDQMGISASMGSACSAGALEPSRTLLNMGFSPKRATSSIRFSFSRTNTLQEVEKAVEIIVTVYTKMSSLLNL